MNDAPVTDLLRQDSIKTENHLMDFSDSSLQACPNRSVTGASFISAYYFNTKVLLSLMYLNRWTNTSKCNLPGFAENFANLCTAKLKSTILDNK